MSAHIPVLLDAVCEALPPLEGLQIVDGTFGAGGYTARFLGAGASVVAFDRDPSAIAAGLENFAEEDALRLIEAPFDTLGNHLSEGTMDAVVFDFGVSSMQLDQAERGFSFRLDGPLDMRMGEGRPVADFINGAEADEIADVLYQYGEERRSRALAAAIVHDRDVSPFETTASLAGLAERVLGNREKIHPATRSFQALRILVNDEYGQIVRGLQAAEKVLRPGGRLVAVTFHSIEDRIVKRFLALASGKGESVSRYQPVTEMEAPASFERPDKAVSPSRGEVEANPRARSARLRSATRANAPALEWNDTQLARLGLPPLVFSDLQQQWGRSS